MTELTIVIQNDTKESYSNVDVFINIIEYETFEVVYTSNHVFFKSFKVGEEITVKLKVNTELWDKYPEYVGELKAIERDSV